jgi:anti-sigma factor RsiW
MTDRSAGADAHAYVDNCLTADAQVAFEVRLGEDHGLRRRVETWQAQNEAIRAAYSAPALALDALTPRRPAGESPSSWMPPQISSRRDAISPREALSATLSGRSATGRDLRTRAGAHAAPRMRLGLVLALALGLLILSARSGPSDPRGVLGEAGLSAFRTFGVDSAAAFDFSSHDARALAKWLSPRFWPAAPEASLEIAGWRPLGVRIVPGIASAAAFIVWETPDAMRAGLLVEPLDAPALYAAKPREAGGLSTAAWTAGGRGFAAVAPDPKALETLTRVGEASGAAR